MHGDRFTLQAQALDARFRALVEAAPDAMLIANEDGRIVLVNEQTARLFACDRALLVGSAVESLVPDRFRAVHPQHRKGYMAEPRTRPMGQGLDLWARRRDGSEFPAEISLSPLRTEEGVFTIAAIRDATERRRLDEERRRSHELEEERRRFRRLVQSDIIGIVVADLGGPILEANDHFLRLVGRDRADLAAGRLRWDALTPAEWQEADSRSLGSLRSAGVAPPWEKEFLRADGERVPVLVGIALLDENRGICYVLDISDRKRTEQRLRENEEQSRLLFVKSPHPMWVIDEETLSFLAVNDTAIDHYGWSREQFLSMSAEDLELGGDPGLRERLADTSWGSRAPGAPATALRHRLKDGSVVDVEISASPIPFQGRAARLVLVKDVTETRRLEAQLRQAQKMEAVGQLAGGIAHDFNNLLSVILGQGELIHRELQPGQRILARVAEMQLAADRAAGLTRQLLAFGRRQVLQPSVLDLNELVAGVERMLRRLLPETIEILPSLQPSASRVRADRGQLEQVLVNLAVNARDAMPDGGRLVVTTADADLDEAQARQRPDLAPGPYVVLGVEDTGHGMDAATLARAFEPFFTTKPEGQGTGLGLAMVYGIVKQSGGHVTVYSEPGRGSAFRIYLPRVEDPASAETRAVLPAPEGGSETLLVVEDQGAVRALLAEILRDAGYRVLERGSAEEALASAQAEPGELHLVLSDVVLPGVSGPALIQELHLLRPGLRAVLMSGYAAETAGELEALGAGVLYLQKPFAADALLRVVRKALDSPR